MADKFKIFLDDYALHINPYMNARYSITETSCAHCTYDNTDTTMFQVLA